MQQLILPFLVLALAGLALFTYQRNLQNGSSAVPSSAASPAAVRAPKSDPATAVVRLKNGNALSCTILSASGPTVVVGWKGGIVAFLKTEIEKIEWGKTLKETIYLKAAWLHAHNPVLRLKNEHVIDGAFIRIDPEHVVIREEPQKGSAIEYQVSKDRVGAIEFNPSQKEAAVTIWEGLTQKFPDITQYGHLVRIAETDPRGKPPVAFRKPGEGGGWNGILKDLYARLNERLRF